MYFVRKPPDWEKFELPPCVYPHPDIQTFGINFENEYTVHCYDRLNAFTCRICASQNQFADFPTLPALKLHVGAHNLVFCHLCLENLNILPKNRRLFNKFDLKKHMNGQWQSEGVRGHPLCKFCNLRFFDDEALFIHARKDHFYCPICSDQRGENQFFK